MTSIQHYIPRFLLDKFIDPDKKNIKVFDKLLNTYLSGPKYPKRTMMKLFFYEHDSFSENEIEELLQKRESLYAPLIEKLIGGEKLSMKEYALLIEFRHITYYRSNEFIAFHNFQKNRGKNSWIQRWDWRSINGVSNNKFDAKKSQLDAIKRVIAGTEPIVGISLSTPICFVIKSAGNKFIIGDNGSVSIGGELDGEAIIVVSPEFAIKFPKLASALQLMREIKVKSNENTVIYENADNDEVKLINDAIKEHAFQYWVEYPEKNINTK